MARATAWIITLRNGGRVAIGKRQMIHLLDQVELKEAHGQPSYCLGYINWLHQLVPVIDLDAVQSGEVPAAPPALLGIVTYQQTGSNRPDFAALVLPAIPAKRDVDDSQACALPSELHSWRSISISCFEDNGDAIPILNLEALCEGLHEHAGPVAGSDSSSAGEVFLQNTMP